MRQQIYESFVRLHFPGIESEYAFIDIFLQMPFAQYAVHTDNRPFEVTPEVFHAVGRSISGDILPNAMIHDEMFVNFVQILVSHPFISE